MKAKLNMHMCALFIEMHNYVTGRTEMDQVSIYIKFHHIFQLCCIKTNHLFKLNFTTNEQFYRQHFATSTINIVHRDQSVQYFVNRYVLHQLSPFLLVWSHRK